MKFTKSFIRTQKNAPSDAKSVNAALLQQAGFIHQEMAGVYSFLPLGLAVLNNIKRIVAEEIEAVDAIAVQMPALSPKKNWETTNRWDEIDVLYKIDTSHGESALCPTHEEIITPLVQDYLRSYKDFPVCLYQFQNKFRNEPRAKSGLLRCREFLMKDAYSFHTSEEDFEAYYAKMTQAYHNIFERLGIGNETLLVKASGGDFSEFSHEFQTLSHVGEDEIYIDSVTKEAFNKEIVADFTVSPAGNPWEIKKAVEVGNIFPLSSKFTDAFAFKYISKEGKDETIVMGCYGIGVSRLMGILAEMYADEKGLKWHKNVAPAEVYLVSLGKSDEPHQKAEEMYETLKKEGKRVIWDDRRDKKATFGAKMRDAELIGCPEIRIISEKTLEKGGFEVKNRWTGEDIVKSF